MEKKMKRLAHVASMVCTIALSGLALQSCSQSDDVEETNAGVITRAADTKALLEVKFRQDLEELSQLQAAYVSQLCGAGMKQDDRSILPGARLKTARQQFQQKFVSVCQQYDLLSDLDQQQAEGVAISHETVEEMRADHDLFAQYVAQYKTEAFASQLQRFVNPQASSRFSVAGIVSNESLKWNERLLLTLAAATVPAQEGAFLAKVAKPANSRSVAYRTDFAVSLSWVLSLAAQGDGQLAAQALADIVPAFISEGLQRQGLSSLGTERATSTIGKSIY